MENNNLRATASVRYEDLSVEQALGSDQLLKVTALLYFKEALVAQKYESCRELIDTAKDLGVSQGDISAVIADHLNPGNPGRQRTNRLRS